MPTQWQKNESKRLHTLAYELGEASERLYQRDEAACSEVNSMHIRLRQIADDLLKDKTT